VNPKYAVKPRSADDLDDYADYLLREAGLEVALRFLTAARETFALLASNPNIGWESRLNNPALTNVRVFRVKGFEKMLIFYRPLVGGIDILRVIHGSRNLQALFRRRGQFD
jgi:toxin ParE1/3/4